MVNTTIGMVSPNIKQTWTILGVLTNTLGQGMMLSYSSILLPSIQSPDSAIKVDIHSSSWIASAIGISSIPAIFACSIFMELYGRRFVNAIVVLPAVTGWLCIYYGNTVDLLILGRAITGFACNASLGAIIIGEYSSPKNRGIFLNLKTIAVCVGYMIVHIFGYFYHWRTVALVALVPHITSLLITFTWPESPSWLASKQKYEESEKSFYWLRGKNIVTINEIEDLVKTQKEKFSDNQTTLTFMEKVVNFFKRFTRKDFTKPVVIVLFGGTLLEACGRHIFPAFAVQIIEEVTGNKAQSFYYTLGIDIIITASAVLSSILVKLVKRRTLLFGSGFAALFILYITCGYLYLVNKEVISNERQFIPITLFVIYFILSNLGCTSIPLILLGEIFPLAHRGAGSFASSIILAILLIIALKVTPFLLVSVKVHGTFGIFGIAMGISLSVLWYILPETKDRTLQEIENYLNFGKYHKEIDHNASQISVQYDLYNSNNHLITKM